MAATLYLVLNAALLFVLLASLVAWGRTLWRSRNLGLRGLFANLVPSQPQQRPFWSPAEAFIMFGTWILIMQVMLVTAVRQGVTLRVDAPAETSEEVTLEAAAESTLETDPSQVVSDAAADQLGQSTLTTEGLLTTVLADSAGKVVAITVVLLWLTIFARSAWRRIGLTVNLRGIRLGLLGALYILPPTMLISAAAAYFVTKYEHPILQSLVGQSSIGVFLVIFIGTAVITPIYEELMVRGCLQGGLQGWADRDEPGQAEGDPAPAWRPRAWWPLIATSVLFGAMHLNHGAAAIPLFFLSLGLGYLYRQTGSLAAPIVVHMILNGTTLVAEFTRLQM